MKKALSSQFFWSFSAVTLFILLLWLAGPQLKLGNFCPLAPVFNRQLLAGLSYFLWIVWQLLPRLYNVWFNSQRLSCGKMLTHNEQQLTEALLLRHFSKVIAAVKPSPFRYLTGKSWRHPRQLPWFLVIGAPGAGKTTALRRAGLHFTFTSLSDSDAFYKSGEAGNPGWWCTDTAVLLDIPGRYASRANQQSHDWQTLITLLRRYRPRQPVSGVIMTISVADLLTDSAETRRAQATALRCRMEELYQQTGITFPVYLMITKTDLLKGFTRYFSTLDKSQRNQFWGFTFPWQGTELNGDTVKNVFHQRFYQLINQLYQSLGEKMEQHPDLIRRADSFLFPQVFALLYAPLKDYLETLFSSVSGKISWPIRGIFFTSATQEGLPFDRISCELSRKLQLSHHPEHLFSGWDEANPAAPAGKAQSYFLHHLFTNLIFAESGLADSNRQWEKRHQVVCRAGYSLLGISLLLLVSSWLYTAWQSHYYLQTVATRISRLTDESNRLNQQPSGDIFDLLPYLNELARLPQTERLSANHSFLLNRHSELWQSQQICDASGVLYRNALRAILLPWIAQLIINTLHNDRENNNKVFNPDAVRAWRMFYQPHGDDGPFLHHWILEKLQHTYPDRIGTDKFRQLDYHIQRLLYERFPSSFSPDTRPELPPGASTLSNPGQQMKL